MQPPDRAATAATGAVRVEPLALKIRLSVDGATAGPEGSERSRPPRRAARETGRYSATRGEYRSGLIVSSEVRRPTDGRRGWGHRASPPARSAGRRPHKPFLLAGQRHGCAGHLEDPRRDPQVHLAAAGESGLPPARRHFGLREECRGIGPDTGCGKERERRPVEGEHTVACIDDHDRLLRDVERGPHGKRFRHLLDEEQSQTSALVRDVLDTHSRERELASQPDDDVLGRAAHTVDELLDDFRIGEVNRFGHFAAGGGRAFDGQGGELSALRHDLQSAAVDEHGRERQLLDEVCPQLPPASRPPTARRKGQRGGGRRRYRGIRRRTRTPPSARRTPPASRGSSREGHRIRGKARSRRPRRPGGE